MADIVNLIDYRIESRGKKVFAPWKKRFNEEFDYFTRLSDLPDKVLYSLANGKGSETALREIVMANLDMGPASKFPFLADDEQRIASRVALFLKAQIFFEIMFRLGWIVEYPYQRHSLTAMVEGRGKGRGSGTRATPVVSDSMRESSKYGNLSPELRKKFLEDRFDRAFEDFDKRMKKKEDE